MDSLQRVARHERQSPPSKYLIRSSEIAMETCNSYQMSTFVGFAEPDRWGDEPVTEVLKTCFTLVQDHVVASLRPFASRVLDV